MKIPKNSKQLAVFLRDYGGRTKKTRAQKIAIMKKILETGEVELDTISVVLTEGQKDLLDGLYNKHILGKWNTRITDTKMMSAFKKHENGLTIRDLAKIFECSEEIVRRKVLELTKSGILIRDVNPTNKRQGVFFLKSRYVIPKEQIATEA
jgi:transposase